MKRRRQRKDTVWKPWPTFLAWCPEAHRFDAFTSTLVALVGAGVCEVFDFDDDDSDFFLPPREAAALIRAQYESTGFQRANIEFHAPSGRELQLGALVYSPRLCELGEPALSVGFWSQPFFEGFLLPEDFPWLKRGGPSSVAIQAGVAWQVAIRDTYEILMRFCTSSPAITTGCCVEGPDWGAPITAAGTYHADGYPGRDLALTWMYLHDKEPIDLAAGWSIDALRERVEASPRGSSVWIVDEDRLAREQVLSALDLPPKDLSDALKAASRKLDPAWEAIELGLHRLLEESSDDNSELIPVTEEHIRFIEDHTPATVKRLDNGALILIAHPDRTLWPLWSDALALLGIRPKR